jgi:hypothetical protein
MDEQPKARPILFQPEMVRAILDGRKLMTRRVINPQPYKRTKGGHAWMWKRADGRHIPNGPRSVCGGSLETVISSIAEYCPFGQAGDRLWVRETWVSSAYGHLPPNESGDLRIEYIADRGVQYFHAAKEDGSVRFRTRERVKRPSIHLPRWASRITLEITGIKVERLQDISEEDAAAEGLETNGICFKDYSKHGSAICNQTARSSFFTLWEKIHGEEAWDKNEWVWAISFRRIKP